MLYDYKNQSDTYLQILKQALYFAFIVSILSGFLLFYLLKSPIQQLNRLIDFAKQLDVYKKGEQRAINIDSHLEEIQELHSALNQSALRLYQQSQELIQSKERYSHVINNVHEVIFQTNTQTMFSFLNAAWQKLSKYPIDSSLGKPMVDFLSPQHQEYIFHALQKLFNGSISEFRDDVQIVTAAHEEIWVDLWISLIYEKDKNGNTITIVPDTFLLTHDKSKVVPIFYEKDDSGEPKKTKSGSTYVRRNVNSNPINIKNFKVDLGGILLPKKTYGGEVVDM